MFDMFKYLINFSFVLIFINLSGVVSAAPIVQYTKLVEIKDNNILFSYGDTEEQDFFSCDKNTFSCTNLGTTSPKKDEIKVEEIKIDENKIGEIKASTSREIILAKNKNDKPTNIKESKDGVYIAYYNVLKGGEKSFVIINKSDLSVSEFRYVIKQEIGWELLTDELTLVSFSPDNKYLFFLSDEGNYPRYKVVDLEKYKNKIIDIKTIEIKESGVNTDILYLNNLENKVYILGNNVDSPYAWSIFEYDLNTGNSIKLVDSISYGFGLRNLDNKIFAYEMIDNGNRALIIDPKEKVIRNFDFGSKFESEIKRLPIKIGDSWANLNWKDELNKKAPIIIWLHGGPYRQTALGYHPFISYGVYDSVLDRMVLDGATVLKLDYSGSYGYGKSKSLEIVENVGNTDTRDIKEAIDYLKKDLGLTGKVYLSGNSYGGYAGAKAIVEYPKEIKGAVLINGVYDWRTLLNYLRTSLFNTHFGGVINASNTKLFKEASVFQKVKNLKNNKITIIHAEKDKTINVDQAYLFSEVLGLKNTPNNLVIIPNEDHVFTKNSSIETIYQEMKKLVK